MSKSSIYQQVYSFKNRVKRSNSIGNMAACVGCAVKLNLVRTRREDRNEDKS